MTSKLTRERLQEIAEDGFLKHGESKELARMALLAMDSEPVADDGIFRPGDAVGVFNVGCETCPDHLVAWTVKGQNLPVGNYWLYISPQPAPVVPDEITSASAPEVFEIAAEAERLGLRGTYASYAVGWNACRAAMLAAAPQEVKGE